MTELSPPQEQLLGDVVRYGAEMVSRNAKPVKALLAAGLVANGGPNAKGQMVLVPTANGREMWNRIASARLRAQA
ncbi:hypothetical protein [Mesorhizobium amorphae]|uniref:hypothetical protein n=1 Tax=Mesorhizobium amorphae TaxID=71433 RepID=UPI0011864F9F|nr:hypothetical protein [Mesorhizobium amorphae]